MAEPFIGEIRTFSFSFAPKDWAPCDGRLLPIADYQSLYAILGTTYGGNGTTTFALPDLRGRAPMHKGNGINLGEKAGEEVHTLTVNEMPAHNHTAYANSDAATKKDATGHVWAKSDDNVYTSQPNKAMRQDTLANSGGGQSHSNMQPYNVTNYCIALTGLFPPRNL